MTKTHTLLAELRDTCPHLDFQYVQQADTVHADDPTSPCQLIGFLWQDIIIVDPFTSSCGRFQAAPNEVYGLPNFAALSIHAHNCPLQLDPTASASKTIRTNAPARP